jgi:hypothetical protein
VNPKRTERQKERDRERDRERRDRGIVRRREISREREREGETLPHVKKEAPGFRPGPREAQIT